MDVFVYYFGAFVQRDTIFWKLSSKNPKSLKKCSNMYGFDVKF